MTPFFYLLKLLLILMPIQICAQNTLPKSKTPLSYRECLNYSDCYSCSSQFGNTNSCQWDPWTQRCNYHQISVTSLKWYEVFGVCEKQQSLTKTNNCPSYPANIASSPPFQGQLNMFSSSRQDNIYCYWIFKDFPLETAVEIKWEKQGYEKENDFFFIRYRSPQRYVEKLVWTSDTFTVRVEKLQEIVFRFYRKEYRNNKGFVLSIKYPETKGAMECIPIIIASVSVAVVIIGVVLYCKKKKSCAEENDSTEGEKESHDKDNTFIVEEMFNTKYVGVEYDSSWNSYGNVCTICWETFRISGRVVKWECCHVFHHECIKKWCFNNLQAPKCPNCNVNLLKNEEEKGEKQEEIGGSIQMQGESEAQEEEISYNSNCRTNEHNQDRNWNQIHQAHIELMDRNSNARINNRIRLPPITNTVQTSSYNNAMHQRLNMHGNSAGSDGNIYQQVFSSRIINYRNDAYLQYSEETMNMVNTVEIQRYNGKPFNETSVLNRDEKEQEQKHEHEQEEGQEQQQTQELENAHIDNPKLKQRPLDKNENMLSIIVINDEIPILYSRNNSNDSLVKYKGSLTEIERKSLQIVSNNSNNHMERNETKNDEFNSSMNMSN